MGKLIDMTGWVMSEHGVPNSRITVIKRAPDVVDKDGKHMIAWWCQCSCGSEPFVGLGNSVRNGGKKSCGCLHRENGVKRGKSSKKENEYDLSGEYGVGYCSNTGNEFYFDIEDYDKIKKYCWFEHVNSDNYHSLRTRDPELPGHAVKMSEVIMGDKRWEHANKNPLDNRKENLRKATAKENNRNRGKRSDNKSGITGVWWDKKINKWRAYIRVDGTLLTLGYFKGRDDAAKTRLNAEKKYFGEFAPQKHLYEKYGII